MELLLWIIGFSLIGGLLSVVVASSFLLLSSDARNVAVPHLVSFAIGALLGASFLGLIPHAMEHEYVEVSRVKSTDSAFHVDIELNLSL